MEPESKLVARQDRSALLFGIVACGIAVAMGAFGAHALEGVIGKWYEPDVAIKRLANWHTAVEYQFFHGIALICLGLWQNLAALGSARRSIASTASMWLFVLGVVLFSGGLFAWVLSANKIFVMIVPIGGGCFLMGWLSFLLSVLKHQATRS